MISNISDFILYEQIESAYKNPVYQKKAAAQLLKRPELAEKKYQAIYKDRLEVVNENSDIVIAKLYKFGSLLPQTSPQKSTNCLIHVNNVFLKYPVYFTFHGKPNQLGGKYIKTKQKVDGRTVYKSTDGRKYLRQLNKKTRTYKYVAL